MQKLRVKRVRREARLPTYGTDLSSCFDLYCCLQAGTWLDARNEFNDPYKLTVYLSLGDYKPSIGLRPQHRVLIPTGFVFDIPEGKDLRILPRSGISFKEAISLSNCTAVIDEDYREETYLIVINNSGANVVISHNDRVAQGELVDRAPRYEFEEVTKLSVKNSNRNGGIGHTGV